MRKVTALADCNNFFVSCEILKDPSLRGKSVCVLSNCDGCVISRSREAKMLGIPMGIPFFKAKKEFTNTIYLSSDLKMYHDISRRVTSILKDFAPAIEIYSIDEAFCDFTGLDKFYGADSYLAVAKLLRDRLLTETGIPVSVGVANSAVLAKAATEKAKGGEFAYEIKYENIEEELKDLRVEQIWGIGRKTASFLRSRGIFYANDILNADDVMLKHNLGIKGLELKYGLAGEDTRPVNPVEEAPKSIQKTSSFGSFTTDREFLKREILNHTHRLCKKLRRYNLVTGEISVMLRTKDFRTITLSNYTDFPTSSELILNPKVINLTEQIYTEGFLYRSAGVYATSLSKSDTIQKSLLYDSERFEKIARISDKLEKKYGKRIFI